MADDKFWFKEPYVKIKQLTFWSVATIRMHVQFLTQTEKQKYKYRNTEIQTKVGGTNIPGNQAHIPIHSLLIVKAGLWNSNYRFFHLSFLFYFQNQHKQVVVMV